MVNLIEIIWKLRQDKFLILLSVFIEDKFCENYHRSNARDKYNDLNNIILVYKTWQTSCDIDVHNWFNNL